jgi:hypothetical protein
MEYFSKINGIALNEHGFLDITREENPTEIVGANPFNKNLPKPFILVNGFGKKLLELKYRINLDRSHTSISSVEKNNQSNRTPYRSHLLNDLGNICMLYHEYDAGGRILHHNELYGLATNLYHIESGSDRFKSILAKNAYFDDRKGKYRLWENHLRYFRQNRYKPQNAGCQG